MKKYNAILGFFLILLACPLVNAIESQAKTATHVSGTVAIENNETDKSKQKNSIDGTTSASKLRAIRSHKVSDEDETKLAVFSGAILIGVILFILSIYKDHQ